jgi:hypothetical protein
MANDTDRLLANFTQLLRTGHGGVARRKRACV